VLRASQRRPVSNGMKQNTRNNFRSGQSLIEILIAVAVGAILIGGVLTVISPSLRINTDARRTQIGAGIAKELAEGVRVLSESGWHSIADLAITSLNPHYLITSSSPFTATSGIEVVMVGTSTFNRYFYIDDVKRNLSGDIVEGGSISDPSTKKLTVVYSWEVGDPRSNSSYISRSRNYALIQDDWGGGPGQVGPISTTGTNSLFGTSTDIDYSTSTGSIRIQGL